MSAPVKLGTVQQYKEQYHYFEVLMYNQITGEKPFNVPFFLIDELQINESLHNWITSGHLILNSDFEIINRGALPNANADAQTPQVKAPYIDRTDGRNRLSVRLYPVNPDETKDPKVLSKDTWEMCFDFVITDIEDLDSDNNQKKKRKYKFVDERFQIFYEKNIEFSTILMNAKKLGKKPNELTVAETELNPNEILKAIITEAATDQKSKQKIKIGFDETGSIDKPTVDLDTFDDQDWDMGDPNNKIFFASPANSNVLEDIFYVLSRCSDKNGFPVILDFGRTTKDKKWHLRSLKDYFDKATPSQVEWMHIEDGYSPDHSPPYIPRADTSAGENNDKNFNSLIASRINNYKYSPMVAMDDNRIKTKPLHYFDFDTGTYHIKRKDNSVKKLIEKLKILCENLYSFKNGKGAQPLLSLNQTKTSHQMIENQRSSSGKHIPKNEPLMKMILDFVFLNQSLTFEALGLTIRAPGKFIYIDRIATAENNPFDDRFIGPWLIVKVTHLFTQASYMNHVNAVKVDTFSKIWPEEDTTT
jgi:hypothetical protein